MPGNIVKINNAKDMEWYVGDSQMDKVIALLDEIGYKEGETKDAVEILHERYIGNDPNIGF